MRSDGTDEVESLVAVASSQNQTRAKENPILVSGDNQLKSKLTRVATIRSIFDATPSGNIFCKFIQTPCLILLGCIIGSIITTSFSRSSQILPAPLPLDLPSPQNSTDIQVQFKLSLLENWSISPKHKLLICRIEKCGNTFIANFVNKLNGVKRRPDEWRASTFYRHSVLGANVSDLKSWLEDDHWVKAVFLRDPVDRFLSAYLSKCKMPKEEAGTQCQYFTDYNGTVPFEEFVSKLYKMGKRRLNRGNIHFRPQRFFCGYLENFYEQIDFVGWVNGSRSVNQQLYQIAKEFPSLNISEEQVEETLNKTYKVRSMIRGGEVVHSAHTDRHKDELLTPDILKKLRFLYKEDYEFIQKLLPSIEMTFDGMCEDTLKWQNLSGKRCKDYEDNGWCKNGAFLAGQEWTGAENVFKCNGYEKDGRDCAEIFNHPGRN